MNSIPAKGIPLLKLLPFLENDLAALVGDRLSGVGVTEFAVSELGEEVMVGAFLDISDELVFEFPLLSGLELVLSAADGAGMELGLKILPELELGVTGVDGVLRFPPSLLRPVTASADGRYEPVSGKDGKTANLEISLSNISFRIDQAGEIGFALPTEVPLSFNHPFMIGDTGVVIEADEIDLVQSGDENAGSIPGGGFGVLIPKATVHLPNSLSSTLKPGNLTLTGFAIGSGGFSGKITSNWDNGTKDAELFGIKLALKKIALEFKQNALIGSEIKATLTIPGFDKEVDVDVGFDLDGNLSLTLTAAEDELDFSIEDVLTIKVDSFGFERKGDDYLIAIGGDITLDMFKDWPGFKVEKLLIDSNGSISIDGGWLDLPKQYSVDFHGFQMEITKIGFGEEDDGRKWVGLSAGIKLVDGLPLGASVEGLRIYWKNGTFDGLTFEGIGVEFEVPGTLRFAGAVAYKDEKKEFRGQIELELLTLSLSMEASLVVGRNTDEGEGYSYFFIYLDLQLPVGIPLYSSGLALYGLAGLFADEMAPSKTADQEWYAWYKKKPLGVTAPEKWQDQRDALAVGAGVTLGTITDNGYAFSSRALLVIEISGPVIMLEARAQVLRPRAELGGGEDPPLSALMVIDGRAGTFLFNVDATYRLPESSGLIVDAQASAEGFFAGTDDWHFYLGEKDPREKRVRAQILGLLQAESYFMIDQDQVAMGARVEYRKGWFYGPVKAGLEAWIEGGVALSWSPVHFSGYLWLHGALQLRAFGFGFSLSADAQIEVDTPEPFRMLIALAVTIDLPWFLPDVKVKLRLLWEEEGSPPVTLPLKDIAIAHLKVKDTWQTKVLPCYDADGDGFDDSEQPVAFTESQEIANAPVVPLDALPALTFARAVDDCVGYRGDPGMPPPETVGEVDRRYELSALTLERKAKGSDQWNPVPVNGQWQAVGNGEAIATKLILGSKNGFDWLRSAALAWADAFLERNHLYPCHPRGAALSCVNFDSLPADAHLPIVLAHGGLLFISNGTAEILPVADHGTQHALMPGDALSPVSIRFPKPVVRIAFFCSRDLIDVTAYYRNTQVVQMKGEVRLVVEKPGAQQALQPIDRIDVSGAHKESLLHKLCYLTQQAQAEAAEAEALNDRVGADVEDWYSADLLLAPNSKYRLTVTTRVLQAAKGTPPVSKEAWGKVSGFEEIAYFRTEGPPGMVTLEPKTMGKDSEENRTFPHPLTNLEPYIHPRGTTLPGDEQRPRPEEPPRPVYRGYDVGVTFNENYVKLMYRLVGRDLALYLYDSNRRPVQDAMGRLLLLQTRWGESEHLNLGQYENLWLSVLGEASCAGVDNQQVKRADAVTIGSRRMVLQPDMLHEVQVKPLLLFDDFSSGNIDAWEEPRGEGNQAGDPEWRVESIVQAGQTRCYLAQMSNHFGETENPAEKPGTYVTRGDTEWTDYRLSVNLSSRDDDAIGVMFRYQDEDNYYRFSMDKQRRYRRLIKKVCGIVTVLDADAVPYERDRVYQVMVEVVEKNIRVYLDGEAILSAEDGDLASGKLGLYTWGNDQARFDTIRVDNLRADSGALYRFDFISSRYVNFYHHLQSFRGRVWGRTLEAELSADALVKLRQEAASAMASARTLPLSWFFEVLKLNPEASPPAVDLSLLSANSERYGLLLESPEPIRWERTGVPLVEHADRLLPAPLPAGSLKVTSATLPPGNPPFDFDANQEYVDVLLQETLDPTGSVVQHLRRPGSAEPVVKERIIFHETFKGAMDAWSDTWTKVDEGTVAAPSAWRVGNGVLKQTSNIYGEGQHPAELPGTYVLAGDKGWDDYRLTVRLQSNDDDAIGVMFRYEDADNYYRFSMDSQRRYRRLIRKHGGLVHVLAEDTAAFETGHIYTLVVDAFGNHLEIWLDGEIVFDVADTSPQALASGSIALYTWGNDDARFYEAEVREVPQKADLLFSDNFINPALPTWQIQDRGTLQKPSAWTAQDGVLSQTSGIHGPGMHPVEFPGTTLVAGDATWDDYRFTVRLRSDDDDAIGVVFRYRSEDEYYRFSMDSQRAYRRLIRRTPGRVTVLWQDAEPYQPGCSYLLVVDAFGDRIRISIDGSPVLDRRDESDEALLTGKIGLYTFENDSAHFTNLRVTRSVSAETKLFHTSFGEGLSGWSVVDEGTPSPPAKWEVVGGSLQQGAETHGGSLGPDDASKPGTFIVGGDEQWSDYRLSVWLRSEDEYAVGVMARYRDPDNYCRFSMDRLLGYRRLIEKVDGKVIVLYEDDEGYVPCRDYQLDLNMIGDQVRVAVDGTELAARPLSAELRSGKVGLYTWGTAGARFNRVLVTATERRLNRVLADEFNTLSAKRWSVVPLTRSLTVPDWHVSGLVLEQTSDHPATAIVTGTRHWTDYTLSTRVRLVGRGAFGVTFGFQSPENAYYLIIDALQARLVKREGQQRRLLWRGSPPEDLTDWWTLRVTLTPEAVGVNMGSGRSFVLHGHGGEGGVGLCTWGVNSAQFDSVNVVREEMTEVVRMEEEFHGEIESWAVIDEGTPSPPAEWAVVDGTLRQTSQAHGGSLAPLAPDKPGTYVVAGDKSWSDYRFVTRLLSTDPYAIGVMFRYQDEDNYYRFSMDHQLGYRRLVRKLEGQVSVLWEDPERVRYAIDHEYLLTVDAFGDLFEIYLDGIKLCEKVDRALATGAVGLYSWGNAGTQFREVTLLAPQFVDYYRFTREERLPEGTLFRIHSGSRPVSAPDDLIEHRYRAGWPEKGEPLLCASGDTIRIIDTGRQAGHRCAFLPAHSYVPKSTAWLHRYDGAASCILFPNGQEPIGGVPGGHYRIELTYGLKPGNPYLPVLSQGGGNKEAETVFLEFSIPFEDFKD